jgi:hypothetical protein
MSHSYRQVLLYYKCRYVRNKTKRRAINRWTVVSFIPMFLARLCHIKKGIMSTLVTNILFGDCGEVNPESGREYCNVVGDSIHYGSIFPFQKVNTLQLNTSTISHSPNTHRASTLSDVPHKTPSTGPLLVISQHKLTLLQSESLQTLVLLSQFPNTKSSNQPKSIIKHTRASTLGYFQSRTQYKSI